MYDPLVGRFLSPDPVFQFINQVTYTFGNPVSFMDDSGREVDIRVGIAVGVVARQGVVLVAAGIALDATLAGGAALTFAVAAPFIVASLSFAIAVGGLIYLITTPIGPQLWPPPPPPRQPPPGPVCDCCACGTTSINLDLNWSLNFNFGF